MGDAKWSAEWPTEPGWYWLFPSGQSSPELEIFCMVKPPGMDCFGLAFDEEIYKEGNTQGLWQRIPEPELPVAPSTQTEV